MESQLILRKKEKRKGVVIDMYCLGETYVIAPDFPNLGVPPTYYCQTWALECRIWPKEAGLSLTTDGIPEQMARNHRHMHESTLGAHSQHSYPLNDEADWLPMRLSSHSKRYQRCNRRRWRCWNRLRNVWEVISLICLSLMLSPSTPTYLEREMWEV